MKKNEKNIHTAYTLYIGELKIGARQFCDGARHLWGSFWRKIWWTIPLACAGMLFKLFYDGDFLAFEGELAERGQFGDSFGVLNSLFTGLGFGGVVVTLVMQQKQIAQQEKQVLRQRYRDELRHYEETLHKLISLYVDALNDVADSKGKLTGRSLLRGSTDRVLEVIKKEKVHIIPPELRVRFDEKRLTPEDQLTLDYLYFRNFKILAVEIDRQGRLVNSLKVLLRHLVQGAPEYVLIRPYCDLVCAQLTYVEVMYFHLIALTFADENEFRDLFARSGLLEKAAHVHRLAIHDLMYEEFWGVEVRQYKKPQLLPITSDRINKAIKLRRRRGLAVTSSYSSQRHQQN